jgi:Peptidase family M23
MSAHRCPHRLTPVIVTALLIVAAAGAGPADAAWRSPVAGLSVTRGFDLGNDPFEAGRHRGADLAAGPGDAVRAPCAGPVVGAGRVGTSGRVVTIRCGQWRVSHMPLMRLAVRVGDEAHRGSLLGTAAASSAHAGLHLGVRRDGDRFGYVDPLRFLEADRHAPPLVPGRPRLGPAPRARVPAHPRPVPSNPAPARTRAVGANPAPARPWAAGSKPLPARPGAVGSNPAPGRPWAVGPNPLRAGPSVVGSNPLPARLGRPGTGADSVRGPVPWPAWVGLALVLGGLGVRWRGGGRGRRARARTTVPEAVR